MQNSQILNDLVTFLRSKNVSEEEIKKITEEITSAASGKLLGEMMTTLPKEDLEMLDKITDESQRTADMRDLVYTKTGKSMDSYLIQYTDTIAEEVYKEARLRFSADKV